MYTRFLGVEVRFNDAAKWFHQLGWRPVSERFSKCFSEGDGHVSMHTDMYLYSHESGDILDLGYIQIDEHETCFA